MLLKTNSFGRPPVSCEFSSGQNNLQLHSELCCICTIFYSGYYGAPKQIVLEGHLFLVSLPVAFLAAGTAVRSLAAPGTSEYQSNKKKFEYFHRNENNNIASEYQSKRMK